MKALELTIFAMAHADGGTYYADGESSRKRLTGAELAAEYWRHNGDTDAVYEGLRVGTFGGLVANGFLAEDLMRRRLDTLHRFATLPHYDEDQP